MRHASHFPAAELDARALPVFVCVLYWILKSVIINEKPAFRTFMLKLRKANTFYTQYKQEGYKASAEIFAKAIFCFKTAEKLRKTLLYPPLLSASNLPCPT